MNDSPDRTVILSNDDGIDADGIQALWTACDGLGRRVISAPDGPQSSCSRAVTIHRPIPIDPRGESRYAIGGTPGDCVRIALQHLAKDPPAWVISGINHGGNLGADIHHSGTVAAVIEAVIQGVPGIAVSHYIVRERPLDWDLAARRVRPILAELMRRPWIPGTFWNVNLPHPAPGEGEPEVVECPVDTHPLPYHYVVDEKGAHYWSDYHKRPRAPGSDVDVCFSGRIAVSLVCPWNLAGPVPGR